MPTPASTANGSATPHFDNKEVSTYSADQPTCNNKHEGDSARPHGRAADISESEDQAASEALQEALADSCGVPAESTACSSVTAPPAPPKSKPAATEPPERTPPPPPKPPKQKGLKLVTFENVEDKKVEWLWEDRFPLGMLTAVYGKGGLGKSTVMMDVAARVTTGAPWPDGAVGCEPGSVLYVSSEDLPHVIRRRLESAEADLSKTHFPTASGSSEGCESINLQSTLDSLGDALSDLGDCRLIVFDPIDTCLGKVDAKSNQSYRSVLQPLAQLAAKHNAAIVMLGHVNKSDTPSAAEKASGSGAFINASRVAWIFGNHPNDPEKCVIALTKGNLSEDPGAMEYAIETDEELDCPRIAWGECIEMTGDELNQQDQGRRSSGKKASKIEAAKDLIAEYLRARNGEADAKEAYEYLKERGVKEATARRARKQLKIKSVPKKPGPGRRWVMENRPGEAA